MSVTFRPPDSFPHVLFCVPPDALCLASAKIKLTRTHHRLPSSSACRGDSSPLSMVIAHN